MAKPYRVTAYVRFSNAINALLVRLGMMRSTSLLTVRGRKSGKPIVTPLAIFVQDQQRYLITPYGVVNWVRNLRAAGGKATLTRGRHTEQIQALELEPAAAAPIFQEAVRTGPPGIPAVFVRMYIHFTLSRYLNVGVNASLEEFEREVLTHPVFRVQSATKEGACCERLTIPLLPLACFIRLSKSVVVVSATSEQVFGRRVSNWRDE